MLRSTHSRGFSSFWTCLHPILTRSSTSTSLSSRLAARISKSTIETSVLGASTPSSTSTAHRTSRLKSLKDKQHALRALRASQTSGKNKSLDTQLRQLLEKDDVPTPSTRTKLRFSSKSSSKSFANRPVPIAPINTREMLQTRTIKPIVHTTKTEQIEIDRIRLPNFGTVESSTSDDPALSSPFSSASDSTTQPSSETLAITEERESPPHLHLAPISRPPLARRLFTSRLSKPAVIETLAPGLACIPIDTYPSRLSSASVTFTPLTPPTASPPIATLAHGLDRVLFNPGVHWLRDPRSKVYNFSRALESLPKVEEFALEKLPAYITSSKDEVLKTMARKAGKAFVSSTSSTTGMLCQIYFWLSKGKGYDLSKLSAVWQDSTTPNAYGAGQLLPQSVVLTYTPEDANGKALYSVDADKSMDISIDTNILASLGHLMEKLLTTDTEAFSRYLKSSDNPIPSQVEEKQAYHYTETEHMILRSQLDATNPHLPNQTFDVKTRGVIAVRQDRLNWEEHGGYLISSLQGKDQSFEREFYDLYRSAYLKYQFQARIGHMDGVLIAFHNTARCFGFSYVPIEEMDEVLFGSTAEGDQVYRLCVGFMQEILQAARDCYPEESVKATFDSRYGKLSIYVEPVEVPDETSTKSRMMLLELSGTNYVDGVATLQVDIKDAWKKKTEEFWTSASAKGGDESDGSNTVSNIPIPLWEVGYEMRKHDGIVAPTSSSSEFETAVSSSLSPAVIQSRFLATRRHQTIFDTLNLPTGVSAAQLQAAVQNVTNNPTTPLAPDDLTLRFPTSAGMTYVSKIPPSLMRMRKMARQGAQELARIEKEELARAEELGSRMFVQGDTSFRVQVVE